MADDGLLLNFSFGDTLATKSQVKGGTWRARRRVQVQGQNRPAPVEQESERPIKKPRLAEPRGTSYGSAPRQSRPHDSGPPKQIISSLFSFNPQPTTDEGPKEVPNEEQKAEPSNAPLTAEQEGLVKMGLSPILAAHLTNKMNISSPTAIQKAAITPLLESEADAFLQAETGSGKTLAYLLPIVQRIMQLTDGDAKLQRDSGLFAIVMAPTRELSKQISVVLESLLRCAHWIVPGIVIGGEKKQSEKARLRKGMNVLVATPGRLVDHLLHTEVLDVSKVRWLVLDEGDRLMELGFEEDIKKIMSKLDFAMQAKSHNITGLPSKRVNILCSATMKMDVQRLGEISLHDATHIHAESEPSKEDVANGVSEIGAFSAPAQLKQTYAVVPAKLRLVSLVALIKRTFVRRGAVSKAIVFMSCADSVDFHFEIFTRKATEEPVQQKDKKALANADPDPPAKKEKAPAQNEMITAAVSPLISNSNNTIKAYRLHGSLPQAVRTSTLRAFSKDTEPAVLICTDVASRGLDVPNVDLVVEYDPPFSKEEHLHRIGRTARAGRDGRASIFLLPGCEEGYVELLKEGRRDAGLGLIRHVASDLMKKGFVIRDENGRERESGFEDRATEWQLDFERWVLESPKLLEMARRAFQSHIRAYATHVATERKMFDMKLLHLGHLCKAFGLRDKPGTINVPGMRPGATGRAKTDRRGTRSGKDGETNDSEQTKDMSYQDTPEWQNAEEAKKKMRSKSRMLGSGADEFNLA